MIISKVFTIYFLVLSVRINKCLIQPVAHTYVYTHGYVIHKYTTNDTHTHFNTYLTLAVATSTLSSLSKSSCLYLNLNEILEEAKKGTRKILLDIVLCCS